jgi:hypothetical protein
MQQKLTTGQKCIHTAKVVGMVSKFKLFFLAVYRSLEEFGAERANRQLAQYKKLGILK